MDSGFPERVWGCCCIGFEVGLSGFEEGTSVHSVNLLWTGQHFG